jgi:haloalkane dehalogenase
MRIRPSHASPKREVGKIDAAQGGLMPLSAKPYAQKKFATVRGRRMAYIDEGQGEAIVFQHGNPTSSYLWRNVMPHCEGLGRLIACDLIGMGDSDKLPESGPQRYTYAEQREYLFGLWDQLALGRTIIFVIHDWGSALGFEWASHHRYRVAGIVYMEGIVTPVTWADWPENARRAFQGFRSEGGEDMILAKNIFVERVLPGSVIRQMSEEEMAEYRRPFLTAGEDRRPTLTWPRQIPVEGEPADVVRVVEDYSAWLATSDVPKLFINAEPGSILTGRQREVCRAWPNQQEVTVKGLHFIQEDSPDEIGQAVAEFVRGVREPSP